MRHGTIYLQYGFWKAAKNLSADVFGPNAWDLFCVLRSSNIHAEIPIEFFGSDDYLSILWHESGGSCFVEEGQIDTTLSKDNFPIETLCSVFLLDKGEYVCNKYAQQKGILCLNAEMLSQKRFLVNGKKISYKFNQKGDFNGLRGYIYHPCNSLILIDPHILNETKYIHSHIKHLLKNLLPESLNIPFHISIFSGIGKYNYDDASLGNSFFEEIDKMLHEIRPHLTFSFTLYQIPIQGEGWHDRFLITNNLLLEASGGFSVFGRDRGEIIAKKDCNFHLYQPILNRNREIEDYYNWIKKAFEESQKNEAYHHKRFGTNKNRLFELVR